MIAVRSRHAGDFTGHCIAKKAKLRYGLFSPHFSPPAARVIGAFSWGMKLAEIEDQRCCRIVNRRYLLCFSIMKSARERSFFRCRISAKGSTTAC